MNNAEKEAREAKRGIWSDEEHAPAGREALKIAIVVVSVHEVGQVQLVAPGLAVDRHHRWCGAVGALHNLASPLGMTGSGPTLATRLIDSDDVAR